MVNICEATFLCTNLMKRRRRREEEEGGCHCGKGCGVVVVASMFAYGRVCASVKM
jgi:hypothetical protein